MKISKISLVIVLAAAFGSHAPAAQAENGQIAAGVAGGLIGGALLGGALARPAYAPPPPVYYAPAPVYVEEDEPVCRLVRERFWDGYGYRVRRLRVCN